MYLSLYRKWRPRIFDEISGQTHITSILKKQCASNRVSHAYLFCGTRGTGKTSSAKILAKAVNCENPQNGNPCNQCSACKAIDSGSATDVLEIDAASNNRVDNIRDLRDEVVYPPSVLKKRVYIVDEVHMLTDSAFNALLKTLEEPPEYVVFILATTEINELPPTIISRCIRFDFSRIDAEAVKQRLEFVAKEENIDLDDGASRLLAELADGSMRDALSLLEACSNGHTGVLTKEAVRNVLGLASDEVIASLLRAVANKNVPEAIGIVEEVHRSSKDISVFIDDISMAVRDLIIEKQLAKFGKSSNINHALSSVADELSIELLFYISSVLEETQGRISKYSMNKRVVLEMSVIKMCDRNVSDSPKALAARISDLEKKLSVLAATGIASGVSNPLPEIKDEAPAEEPEAEAIKEQKTVKPDRVPFTKSEELYEFLNDKPSLSAFLKQSRIYVEGDEIVVIADRFVLDMIKIEGGNGSVVEAFASVMGKVMKVRFETAKTAPADPQQMSLIDEL